MATFQLDYHCMDCSCALPDDAASDQCAECFEKEKFEQESTFLKHKDFLAQTPTEENLKETIQSLDESFLANFIVTSTIEHDQIDNIRKKCVYDAIVDIITDDIQVKRFQEISTVLETYNWDDNSYTDSSPRDSLIEMIETRLKQIPGIKLQSIY